VKVYLSDINESWIVDRMRDEWYEHNPELSSKKIKTADTIWIISPWLWGKLPKKYLKKCKVVCSIYHFEEKDYSVSNINEFYKRDKYVDSYHVISPKVMKELQKFTSKPITYIPFWVNQNIWFEIKDKKKIRTKHNIPADSYVIGSFQRDTEGKDLKSPKLIKGPDRLVEIAKYYKTLNTDLIVLLSGKRRQYIMAELKKENINFLYYEMASFEELNEFYNILDLYIVSSRIEGGPQAIVESGISKTPIISTDVGFASEILSNESIFNMSNFKNAKPNTDFAYKKSRDLVIPEGFEKFIKMLS
tara:strand:+ start:763 stop:1671 length:909 start_codon:yes stop_codon:yes gene_type:complete